MRALSGDDISKFLGLKGTDVFVHFQIINTQAISASYVETRLIAFPDT